MKTIFEAQNEEKNIILLAAQRQLYSEGKMIQWYLFVLVVPLTILVFILGKVISPLETFASIWGVIITLFEVIILKKENSFRNRAAKIQELFDTRVLQLKWNDVVCQAKPESEDYIAKANKHLRKPQNKEKLLNWYFENTDCLSLAYSRLICQRANLFWDSSLRRRFASILLWGLIILGIGIFIIASLLKTDVPSFVFSWLVPVVPAYIWGIIQFFSQRNAANDQEFLKVHLRKTWDDALEQKIDTINLEGISRDIQTKIYMIRKDTLPIPDVLYNGFRNKDQKIMYVSADQLCTEAKEFIKENNLDIT